LPRDGRISELLRSKIVIANNRLFEAVDRQQLPDRSSKSPVVRIGVKFGGFLLEFLANCSFDYA